MTDWLSAVEDVWLFSISAAGTDLVHVSVMAVDFPYVLLTIWRRSPFLKDRSEAVLDS